MPGNNEDPGGPLTGMETTPIATSSRIKAGYPREWTAGAFRCACSAILLTQSCINTVILMNHCSTCHLARNVSLFRYTPRCGMREG